MCVAKILSISKDSRNLYMPTRISGITLQEKKQLAYALTGVYGIGISSSKKILDELGIDPAIKPDEMTSAEEQKLREYIEKNIRVEGELRRDVAINIKRHRDIGSYRGTRHSKRLPVRGQRTKTNSRTVRGNVRKTAGSGRKSTNEKT